ncbi:EmrB/QacA subfamily drug resistance transporter [Rahnella sp. BIGb0603]|uniref:MFS transporter n=1 Tax=Rahnella sp. BIGb0603 TaxID=2940612 RepID=UPI002169DBC3|nr:MFS transporter [Rahnella sp. BIGb0603]MCS3422676.1 EmrB/QacA subfamily drug resistance transporter [Rahnella sp. BIGb0603]
MSFFSNKKFSLPPGSALPLLVAGAFFMENLDATVIVTALPQMAKDFGVHPVDMNIGVSAYILTLTVFIPASGWIANRFGTRNVFSLALILFTLASLLCSASVSLSTFTAARMLQGFAGALMVPVGRLVVLKNTQKSDLIRAIATITWPGLVAPILGPPLGGFITTYASWHWIFLLNLPLGIIALVFSRKLIPQVEGQKGVPFDVTGFVLTGAACLGLIFGLDMFNQGTINWKPVTMVGGAVIVGALAVWHSGRATHPLLPLTALKIKSYAVTIYGGSLFRVAIGALPFLLPLMFQLGYGMNAFDAGLLVLAVFAGNLAMKPFTSPILHRFRFKSIMLINGLLNSATIFACALLTPDVPTAITLLLLFASGMTRSMQFTALNTLAFSQVPAEQMGGANTLFNTAQQLSTGLGIAIGALSLRVAEHFLPASAGMQTGTFHIAFIIIGVFSLAGTLDSLTLDPTAGDEIRRKKESVPQPASSQK